MNGKHCGNRRWSCIRRAESISVGVALLLSAGGVLAESNGSGPSAGGGSYVLQPTRVAGGASTVSGGTFTLVGTVGQHDAQVVPAQGGSYEFAGGYHPAASGNPGALPEVIFVNGFE